MRQRLGDGAPQVKSDALEVEELITLAEDAADGARQLQATLGLQQNNESAIRADVTKFTAKKAVEDSAVADRLSQLARENLPML